MALLVLGVVIPILSPFLFNLNGHIIVRTMVGDSMYPTLNRRDLVLSVPVWDAYKQVDVDDIIQFKNGRDVVVHRVYDIDVPLKGTDFNPNLDVTYRTTGDNSPGIQSHELAITADRIIGKVVYVIAYPMSVIFIFTPILTVIIWLTFRARNVLTRNHTQ